MTFEQARFHANAKNGEVGYTAFLAHHALKLLAEAVERIAEARGVDVGEQLRVAPRGMALDAARAGAGRLRARFGLEWRRRR